MAGLSRQKQKLLTMKQYFERKTDEDHSITGNKLIDILATYGIKAERKTIYDDIKTLIDSGMDIVTVKDGHSNAYYMGARTFQDEELFVLVDAIASCKFLTKKKSQELIAKIQGLTSEYKAQQLRREVFVNDRSRTVNEQIYYNIDAIYEAINSNCEIQFDYMSRRPDGSRTKRGVYTASPYGLCWDSENYYLIAHREDKGRTHFRVDRMEHIRLLDTPRKSPETYRDLNMAQYSKQVFGMFGGKTASVRLQFPNELADSAADRFGNDIMMIPQSDGTFTLTVDVDVSPVFFSWIFSFSGRVKILGPESVAEQYREMCRSAAGI